MRLSSLRRHIGLALLVLFTSAGLHAESFSGTTYIDFNARGHSNYNLSFFASIVPGGQVTASAYASFGNLWATSDGFYGEAGAGMTLSGIHKVNGQWVAASVVIYELWPDASGYKETYYSNLVIPATGYVTGYAYSDGYNQTVYGQIDEN